MSHMHIHLTHFKTHSAVWQFTYTVMYWTKWGIYSVDEWHLCVLHYIFLKHYIQHITLHPTELTWLTAQSWASTGSKQAASGSSEGEGDFHSLFKRLRAHACMLGHMALHGGWDWQQSSQLVPPLPRCSLPPYQEFAKMPMQSNLTSRQQPYLSPGSKGPAMLWHGQ